MSVFLHVQQRTTVTNFPMSDSLVITPHIANNDDVISSTDIELVLSPE